MTMSVMPRSRAVQIGWIERSSSVPPHIQPPITHVPSPIRDGLRSVPPIVVAFPFQLRTNEIVVGRFVIGRARAIARSS